MAKLKSGTRIYGTATVDTSVVVGSAVTLSSSGLQVTGTSLITGISTVANLRITPVGTGATVGGIGVTYYGDGSLLTGISASGAVSISTNTTNQAQFITYAISTGSTTGLGVTASGLVFNPSTTRLGIGTTNPTSTLTVAGTGATISQLTVSGVSTFAGITTVTGPTLFSRQLNVSGVSTLGITTTTGLSATQLSVSGVSTFAGITTVTGTTLFSRQLNVSGVSTFNNTLNVVPTATSIAGLFSGTTSSDMVSITQLGTGNALRVEDSINPDSSPFVVTGTGSVGIGTTNPTQSLDINENLRIRGGLYVGAANTSGISGQVLQSTGTGVTWVSGGGGLTGIKSDGTVIASGVTINTLDFTGTGITSVSYDSGTSIASIDIRGTERRSQSFTATSNQTIFTITNGYTPGYVDVYLNGSKLQQSAEFTATDGSTVVLTSGATADDIIDVVSFFLGVYSNPNYVTTRSVTRTVATASQTSFSVSYDVGYVDVYLNGSKLDSTEFTATTGSTVVLTTAATVNDVLEFISYATLSVNTLDTTVVNETTNATRYITFTDVTSGSISTARVSSSGLTFNPSTGVFDTQNISAIKLTLTQGINATGIVTATGGFVGNVTGNVTGDLTGTASNATNATSAGTATTATNANNVNVSNESSDTTCYPVFVTTATGNQAPKTNTGFYFDSATGTLYATKFSGDGSLLTGITASDITLDAMLFGA